jgi:hypothetical protein
MKRLLCLVAVAMACGCAGPGSLTPAMSTQSDVRRVMGEPALTWPDAEGWTRLVYPRGPMGYQTWVVLVDPAGKVGGAENVLDEAHFALIKPGMTQEQVLHVLGPPQPAWTTYFPRRDELAWEWRYCDDWHAASRFDVLFDASLGTVRSALRVREECRDDACFCAR